MTLSGFHFLSKLQTHVLYPIHSCRLESHSNASNVDASCHIDAHIDAHIAVDDTLVQLQATQMLFLEL
jgi:hypothetical protein